MRYGYDVRCADKETFDVLNQMLRDYDHGNINKMLKDYESGNLVSVVKCKDCKYWNGETKGCVRNPCVEPWRKNDFCSYGKKVTE